MTSPDGRVYEWSRGGVDSTGPPQHQGVYNLMGWSSASTLVRVIFSWHLFCVDLNDYFIDDYQRIVSALVVTSAAGTPPEPLRPKEPGFYAQEFLHLSHHMAGPMYPQPATDVHGRVPNDKPGLIDVAVNRRSTGPNMALWWVWGTTQWNNFIWYPHWTRSVLMLRPPPP